MGRRNSETENVKKREDTAAERRRLQEMGRKLDDLDRETEAIYDGYIVHSMLPAHAEIIRLAQGQPTLATCFDDLLGDGGPSDETADEMIRAIRDWRERPSNRSLT